MRATVSRVARKHIYRAVGRSVREGLEHFYGAILSIHIRPASAPRAFRSILRGGLIHELRRVGILGHTRQPSHSRS